MSSLQAIDLNTIQLIKNKSEQSGSSHTDLMLTHLQSALEALLTQNEKGAEEELKSQVITSMYAVGAHLQKLYEQNPTLPKQNIRLFFEFLEMLSTCEQENTKLKAFLGEANNAFGMESTKIANEQFKKVQHKIYKEEHQPWWKKALEFIVKIAFKVILPIALVTLGALSMDPAMIAGGIFTMAMVEGGGLKELSDGLTDALKGLGASDEVANMVGGLLATALMTIFSFGVGAVASLETVGTEIGDEVVEKLTVNAKKMMNVALMGGSTALAVEGPKIVNGFVSLLPISNEMKEIFGTILLVILELVAVTVLGVGLKGALAQGATEGENVIGAAGKKLYGKVESWISEKLPGVLEGISANSGKIISAAGYASLGASAVGGSSMLLLSLTQFGQAGLQKSLGEIEASLTRLNHIENWSLSLNQQNEKDLKSLFEEYSAMIREASKVSTVNNVAADYLAL